MIETRSCMSGYDCDSNPAQNSRTALMASEMVGSCSVMQVQRRYHQPDNIKSNNGFHITERFQNAVEVFIYSKRSRSPNCFQQRRTSARLAATGVLIVKVFELQNGEKTQWRFTQARIG
jgi:hypothetical protein